MKCYIVFAIDYYDSMRGTQYPIKVFASLKIAERFMSSEASKHREEGHFIKEVEWDGDHD